jgi:hypothetical protein
VASTYISYSFCFLVSFAAIECLLSADRAQIHGSIANTGHSVVFTVDNTTTRHVNITGGPLSYRYQFHEIHVHFGLRDDAGSEHTVNGYAFPAEVSTQLPVAQVRWKTSMAGSKVDLKYFGKGSRTHAKYWREQS